MHTLMLGCSWQDPYVYWDLNDFCECQVTCKPTPTPIRTHTHTYPKRLYSFPLENG
jgi:hypothetical protein